MTTHPTFIDAALAAEAATPDRVWLTQPMGAEGGGALKTFTYRQAFDEVRRMAGHLRGLGLPPGSPIALASKNTAWWILTDLAILMAGHISVPLYPTLTSDTVRQILDHSEAKLLFVGKLDVWDEMKQGVPAGLPMVALPLSPSLPADVPRWDALVAAATPMSGPHGRKPEDLATLIYTSGSTGAPKGVMHSFRTMTSAGYGLVNTLGLNASDRMLSYLPLSHAMERWLAEVCGCLAGFSIFFAESLDTFVQDLQRAQPTLFISVPRLWLKFQQGVLKKVPQKKLDRLLKIPIVAGVVKRKILRGLGLGSVRFAGSGSAPIPPEVIAWFRRLGLELLEGYGMSENFNYSHVSKPGRTRVGYVGEPYPEVQCRISDVGEIQVKSVANMLGYYKQPELTAEAFTDDGFLKTGDRGEVDELGRLRITGRTKELFKTSKGKYVAPAPIENALLTHQRLEQACVTGSGHPQPFAVVVLHEDTRHAIAKGAVERGSLEAELETIRQQVNAGLDPHEHLELLVVAKDPWLVENGFLTPTLKMKRATVEAAFLKHAEGWFAARRTVIWE